MSIRTCHLAAATIVWLWNATPSAVLAQPETQTERQGFSSTDLTKLRTVGAVSVSPDGVHLIYSAGGVGNILYDVASGQRAPIKGLMGGPVWSPDSKKVAFLGSLENRSGIICRPLQADGFGPAEFIAPVSGTNHPLPARGASFAWSPDSLQIAYVSSIPGPKEGDPNGDPRVITRYLYKPKSGSVHNDNRLLQIFVVDLDQKQPRQLTQAPYHHHSVNWSKADEILFSSNQRENADRVYNEEVYALNISSGSIRRLSDTLSMERSPTWSPDGDTIAMQATTRSRSSSETRMEDDHVWVMNPDGSGRRDISQVFDNRQTEFQWSGDGDSLYISVMERADVRLYRVPIDSSKAPEVIAPMPNERGKITGWSVSNTGVVAYAMATPENPGEVYLRTPDAASGRRITTLNDEFLATRILAETDRFTFPAEGGLEVEAFLTKPLKIDAKRKHPLIVQCHGGPHSRMSPHFLLKAQVYAAKGWATLMVNFRGSSDYGQEFADAILGDQNGAEARDVLTGVDMALARYPWLDASRMGIQGDSYGGQMTNWIVTQTDRFQAAISVAGISNLVSFNYMAYYHDYLAIEFGAYPHEGDLMDLLFQRSPIRHVAKVKTPVMFFHGEGDNDVPLAEAEQFFIALQDVGVETVMVIYPGQGHSISGVKNQIDMLDRAVAWYEKHFGE